MQFNYEKKVYCIEKKTLSSVGSIQFAAFMAKIFVFKKHQRPNCYQKHYGIRKCTN